MRPDRLSLLLMALCDTADPCVTCEVGFSEPSRSALRIEYLRVLSATAVRRQWGFSEPSPVRSQWGFLEPSLLLTTKHQNLRIE